MGTHSSKTTFTPRSTAKSTNPAKGKQGTSPLGSSSTHPTGKLGQQKYGKG